MPTLQETFDLVVNALRKQGCKSVSDEMCLYRGPNGTKCAAGHLIPDADYLPSMEGVGVTYKGPWRPNIAPIIEREGHDLKLVGVLQTIHDDYKVEDWETKWQDLADENVLLTYTPPE